MQQTMLLKSWVMVLGLLAVVFMVALIAALSSGRVWAVAAGVIGTLALVVGGLLVVGVLFLVKSAREVEQATVELTTNDLETMPKRETLPPLPAEAPEPTTADVISAEKPTPDAGPPRPAWMDGTMGRVDKIYRTTVKVGPMFSRTECERQLPKALDEAVRTYADHLLGEDRGRFVHLSPAYVRNHIVRDEWEERRQTTFDTMITLHELLEFDREANDTIEAEYRQAVVIGRLGYTAAGGGVVLGLLTVLFGYLKLDTLTRGYYTGRLRFTAAAAILALAAIAGLLALA